MATTDSVGLVAAVTLTAAIVGALAASVACLVTFYGVRSDRRAERMLASHELGWRFETELQDLLPALWTHAESTAGLSGDRREVMNRLYAPYSQVYRAGSDDLLRDNAGDWNGLRREFRFWAEKPLGLLALQELVVEQAEYWPNGFATFVRSEIASEDARAKKGQSAV